MNELVLPKTSQNEFDEIQSPLELDLMAFFNDLQDSVLEILDKDIEPEQMIAEIQELLT